MAPFCRWRHCYFVVDRLLHIQDYGEDLQRSCQGGSGELIVTRHGRRLFAASEKEVSGDFSILLYYSIRNLVPGQEGCVPRDTLSWTRGASEEDVSEGYPLGVPLVCPPKGWSKLMHVPFVLSGSQLRMNSSWRWFNSVQRWPRVGWVSFLG